MHALSGSLPQIFQRAITFHDYGRLSEAEQLYQTVLTGDDRHFGSLCRLGLLRLQQGRFDDAERLFRRAVKVDKRSADAHQFLGAALTGLARLKEAIRSYEKAIAIRPAFAEAHNSLGYALQVGQPALRALCGLLNGINLMLAVQSCLQKFSCFRLTQIKSISPDVPPRTEGRFAIVTDAGREMRCMRQRWARDVMAGRVSARERSNGALTNGA